ncbi:MAG: SpaH/EbpB family LPXTG-anchored major pilin [Eggerthellaceae bacterium]|nr:SpaH/EbpB family LPXTG-anchored major pilin [Eggerthellaceae bacterium]MCH4221151.1 SpaH/EbpB family LPXTG-anchored major pilin [Eggerthellaceae bacterium]
MSNELVRHGRLKYSIAGLSIIMMLLVAFCMTIGTNAQAFAFDNGGLTGQGSITLHKYKTDTASSVTGTGASGQSPSGTTLQGAKFTLYKLNTSKVEGSVSGTSAATSAPDQDDVPTFVQTYGGTVQGTEKTATNTSGTIAWNSLDLGYYLLVEDEATAQSLGVHVAAPSIITVPYYNSATSSYNKDVVVYPKDVASSDIEKTLVSSTHDGYVGAGDDVEYKIVFELGASKGTQIKTTDGSTMSLSIKDVPVVTTKPADSSNSSKNSSITSLTGASATIKQNGGQSTSWSESDVAKYFSKTSIPEATAIDPSTTWTLNSDGAEALKAIWGSDDSNPITEIEFHVKGEVSSNITNLSLAKGVTNTGVVQVKDTSSKVLTDGSATSDAIPTGGFAFSSLQLSETDKTQASTLTGTTMWQLSSSYENAMNEIYLNQGSLPVLVSSRNGVVSISGLAGSTMKENGSTYAAVKAAFDDAKSNPGTAQMVSLWLSETLVSDGYTKLATPVEVKMSITYNSTSKQYTTTTTGGNVPNTATASAQSVITSNGTSFGVVTYKTGQAGSGSFQLPNTGGAGVLCMVIGGVLLMLTAGGYVLYRRQKNQQM